MSYDADGCRPAAYVLNKDRVNCKECPFPFCVISEALVIRANLVANTVMIMQRLGNSINEMAQAISLTKRSIYRYAAPYVGSDCYWCNIIHSKDVMCKSDTYTVVYSDGHYNVVLNRHLLASKTELSTVECFLDYVFPCSVPVLGKTTHYNWKLTRVKPWEEVKFKQMCAALDKYTLGLSEGTEYLQQVEV